MESVDAFTREWEERSAALCSDLASADATPEALAKADVEIGQLRQLLSQAAPFLPPYEASKAQGRLDGLVHSADAVRDRLAPPKKFGFRSRGKAPPKEPQQAPHIVAKPLPTKSRDFGDNAVVRSNLTDTEVRIGDCDGKDVRLETLSGCRVIVEGRPSTVHLSDAHRTHLSATAETSVFLETCSEISASLVCQQLRVHATKDSTFRLHIASAPIIEDCHGIRVAPLRPLPVGVGDSNLWDHVKDFDWLSVSEPSPNWAKEHP